MAGTETMIPTPKSVWAGRILSALIVLFLFTDSVMKFLKPAPVVQTCVQLGLPLHIITPLGVLCLICTVLYAIPKTACLGAVLLTGYLGGAVATHLRVGDPLFSHVLFPVYLGILAWLGLYLRDAQRRTMLRASF